MPAFQLFNLPYQPDSEYYFRRLYTLPGSVWLDSGKPTDRANYDSPSISARYDILTAEPREAIISTEGGCRVEAADGQVRHSKLPPLTYIANRLSTLGGSPAESTQLNALPFIGGAVGYISYEATHGAYGLNGGEADPALADIWFGIYDWALIQDHQQQQAWLVFHGRCPAADSERIRQLLQTDAASLQTLPAFSCGPLQADIARDDYIAAVARIQQYILAGDCYQVNYTQRFTGPFSGSPAAAYLGLRHALSGPFSAYIAATNGHVLSLSPERFIAEVNGHVMTQPIKGTAPRGTTAHEDAERAAHLQQSAKDRAENVMIVDLLRNDLSKVCQPHSVNVTELFGLHSFTNVHHLVSTIEGKLRPGVTAFDMVQACFPGGSITGAPKKRAMEIIAELETFRRGVYCGSVMYFSLNGQMDSNIAIRSLVQSGNRIYCWGGGGIVADSDPEAEYQESLHKIGLLLALLQSASEP